MVNTKPGLSPGPLRWRINKRLCNKRKGGMDLDLSQFRIILNCIFFIEVSNKQQARKLQATGHKILVDSYFIIRYSRINMIGLLIGQCAQAWNLQSSLPLKCRGVGRNSGLQAKPFFKKKNMGGSRPQALLSTRDTLSIDICPIICRTLNVL